MNNQLKNSVFWDTAQCGPLKVSRQFGGTYPLNLQQIFQTCFAQISCFGLLFYPENGGDIFHRNSCISTVVRTSNPVNNQLRGCVETALFQTEISLKRAINASMKEA
jgi:hypothetical protein